MANLFESGTFTTAADLLSKIDLFLVNIAGYTRNMAPTVDNTYGTGSRAHYQRTNTDGRQIFVNLKSLSAMLNSGTYIPDGISANISDGYSAAVQWHLQPGGPVMKGAGLSGNAAFVSSRILSADVTAKPYDFYTDGYNCVLLYATGTITSNWSTATYYQRHGLIFGFLEDTGCGTGFAATGGTAGTFIYGKPTTAYSSNNNGMLTNQDLHLGFVQDFTQTNAVRAGFLARVKSGTFDGYASGMTNYNSTTASTAAGRTTALAKAQSDYRGWVTDYMANPDIAVGGGLSSTDYGNVTLDINTWPFNGFFPTQWTSHNAQFSPITGKFFCYQPCWFCRDETTLRWFPIGRFPLVYQQRTDTTNLLANPTSITVGNQAFDIRGPLWIKKITV